MTDWVACLKDQYGDHETLLLEEVSYEEAKKNTKVYADRNRMYISGIYEYKKGLRLNW